MALFQISELLWFTQIYIYIFLEVFNGITPDVWMEAHWIVKKSPKESLPGGTRRLPTKPSDVLVQVGKS